MSIFICEKCGKLDNTACGNNYWIAYMNKNARARGENPTPFFKPKFAYFETHACCSDCCEGVEFYDNSGILHKSDIDIENKEHWSKYGKEELLEWEARKDGSMENASEYFKENKI